MTKANVGNDYSGSDILEVMLEAVNYNRFLRELVALNLSPTDHVVDFGAGIGTFALELVHKCEKLI